MPALDGAIALEQVDQVAMLIAEDLKLDVTRAFDVALDEQRAVAKRALRFAAGRVQRFAELVARGHDPHAAAASARRRFDEHREFEIRAAIECRHDRDTGRRRDLAGVVLETHHADRLGARPDESQPGAAAGFGEVRALGEKTIAGVDGVGG